ncbi:MAG: DUF2333 family protein [Desulfobacterales bacterium]
MENQNEAGGGFKGFAAKRIIVGILLAIIVLLVSALVLGYFTNPMQPPASEDIQAQQKSVTSDMGDSEKRALEEGLKKRPATADNSHISSSKDSGPEMKKADPNQTVKHDSLTDEKDLAQQLPAGVAFVEATIKPLRYELSERFWGWRPNDIFSFVTDNVNNFQLGVVEVTRRTVEKLTENISRTGPASAFDKHLENARSTCFVIEAESFMFPSSEKKYNDGLKELEKYVEKLKKGEANFYTRADNLIPLLIEYEHLLGSCDDNLVKFEEDDGSKVSFFKADDYFYYAQGVVSSMSTILKAIEMDFHQTLDRRNSLKELHHAIASCEHALRIDPILVINSDLSSIFANHRANLAAHISHARFYIAVLIKTLST